MHVVRVGFVAPQERCNKKAPHPTCLVCQPSFQLCIRKPAKRPFNSTNPHLTTEESPQFLDYPTARSLHMARELARASVLLLLLYSQSVCLIPCTSCWIDHQQRAAPPRYTQRITSFLLPEAEEEARTLQEQAQRLRQEVIAFEQAKQSAKELELQRLEREAASQEALRSRYAATIPILKPDGTVEQEMVDFPPYYSNGTSSITLLETPLPIGVILGESESFLGAVAVDEVAPGSNGEKAGLQVGDLVRAFTACRMQMNQPAWQLMAGGIGIPKMFRYMYAADNQPFEQVMNAIASNRMDPQSRPVLIVVERVEGVP